MNTFNQHKITVLLPGGFKPLTGAHLNLANRYARLDNVSDVIMLIGPKQRDTITQQDTLQIFDILNDNSKISMQPTEYNSPIQSVYEFLFGLPSNTNATYALASSSKGTDYTRIQQFLDTVEKYKTHGDRAGRMIPENVHVTELNVNTEPMKTVDGDDISATNTRHAIQQRDLNSFTKSYPNHSNDEIQQVWDILTSNTEITETINPSEAYDDEDALQTIIDAKRLVGFFTKYGASYPHEKLLQRVEQNNLQVLPVDGNPTEAFIVYHPRGYEDAVELKKIAEKYGGFLSVNATREDTIRIGELLGYDDESIDSYVKQRYTEMFDTTWWKTAFDADIFDLFEGYPTKNIAKLHKSKIKKLKSFLNKNRNREFVYDTDKFPKTVFGVKITEGGAGGHMAHPWEDYGLTFGDLKELVSRALTGRLDIETAVTEKTDGQNIQVTWKNGEVGFARNKGTIINPLTTSQLIDEFNRKYNEIVDKNGKDAASGYKLVVDGFKSAAEDLSAALNKIPTTTLETIFKNGRVFANMEIIYPSTKNVIAYDKAHLQFHNLVEYDEKGNVIQTDLTGGALMQKVIQDANAHLQKTFSFIPPQQIKLGKIHDFDQQRSKYFNEINWLQQQYNLKDTDLVQDYHKSWWKDLIKNQAKSMNYDIPDEVLNQLMYRWAFGQKSTRINEILKQIKSDEFAKWVTATDKTDIKQYRKQNIEPFENIFLRLGAQVLKNATNYLAANPDKTVQDIRHELTQLTDSLRQSNNESIISQLEHQLKRIERLGGFDAIVPTEGIVFTFRGNTYKLTGAFAAVNQILGVLKYSR
jgi:hypothetical protein